MKNILAGLLILWGIALVIIVIPPNAASQSQVASGPRSPTTAAAGTKEAPVKLPDLDQQDLLMLNGLLNDPDLEQARKDLQATQDLAKARTDLVNAKTETLQLKISILTNTQFPMKYNMLGYVYDLQKGWVKTMPAEKKK